MKLYPSLAALLGIALQPIASAGDAFFTPDGKTVITSMTLPRP